MLITGTLLFRNEQQGFLLPLNMVLTDTHTHIYYESPEKQAEIMQRCLEKDITRLFLPNVDVKSVAMIEETVAAFPGNCFAMAGLHPCDVKEGYEAEVEKIFSSIAARKIVAIGEIGIDLYWGKTTLDIQKKAFGTQIRWARELDLPIVIHCRDAFNEVFEVLEQEQHEQLRGVFHCFTGSLQQAERALKMNFYLGIGGVVTYKNSGLDAVVRQIPVDRIVLETDSPYLAPVPFRGKPNESSYLTYIAQKVADIYEITVEEVAAATTRNSEAIFNI